MKRLFPGVFLVLMMLFAPFTGNAQGALATNTSLRDLIDQKASQLQEIEAQKQLVEKSLNEVDKAENTLKKEIGGINSAITQLNLSVKSNKLNVEKLGLEVSSLNEDIDQIQAKIEQKKETMKKLFFELQQREDKSLLEMLLANDTLSESVGTLKNIEDMNKGLSNNLYDLRSLHEELYDKKGETQYKKRLREQELITLANRQVLVQEQKSEKQKLLEITKNQEKIYQQKLSELEKLQAEVSEEIAGIEAELRKGIDSNALPIPRQGVFIWPVNGGRLSQAYGRTAFALRNYASNYHNGIDIAAPVGTEIYAAEDGRVINAGDQDRYCRGGAYGKFVVIKHQNGLTTLYGHMSRHIVTIGQQVTKGEVIGYMGRTGWATGPHLHFTVFASNTLTPARAGYPEGTKSSRSCGPMPVGGDLDPAKYVLMR